jgi:hypothetical protein
VTQEHCSSASLYCRKPITTQQHAGGTYWLGHAEAITESFLQLRVRCELSDPPPDPLAEALEAAPLTSLHSSGTCQAEARILILDGQGEGGWVAALSWPISVTRSESTDACSSVSNACHPPPKIVLAWSAILCPGPLRTKMSYRLC